MGDISILRPSTYGQITNAQQVNNLTTSATLADLKISDSQLRNNAIFIRRIFRKAVKQFLIKIFNFLLLFLKTFTAALV